MQDDIIRQKIEKAIKLVCQLYKKDIITDAYLLGSVAKGTAKKESDIDIDLVNPLFQDAILEPLFEEPAFHLPLLGKSELEELLSEWKATEDLINIMKNMGVEFKKLRRKGDTYWYYIYEGEMFHILTRRMANPFLKDEGLRLPKDMCDNK